MNNSERQPSTDEFEHLRRQLEEARSQLARANAEFEEFVSMGAHNVRQALRDVTSFSQLIAENYAGCLGSEGGMYLDRVQEGAVCIQLIMTDVVDYWTAATGATRLSRMNMEDAMRQAVLTADNQIAEKQAVLTHDPLPAVTGDFELLTKVLHHLIQNAIQYCGAPTPRVHVSAKRSDSDWVISVEDNGPGIEAAFQSRIFLPFRRLHGKEYPGSGLGLAFCKKAIEWQGGRIWMESRLGAGATFCFSVAAAD